MGFFSYLCAECGRSILSPYSVDKGINEWMNVAVAHFPDGTSVAGSYDGYGGVYDPNSDSDDDLSGCCWRHRSCWVKAGKPGFTKVSPGAPDQGFFFSEGTHDVQDPLNPVPEAEWLSRILQRNRQVELTTWRQAGYENGVSSYLERPLKNGCLPVKHADGRVSLWHPIHGTMLPTWNTGEVLLDAYDQGFREGNS